jgi:hypothetical protein
MCAVARSTPPNVCPRQGHRRSAPRFCAAGAGGVSGSNIRRRWRARFEAIGQRLELAGGISPREIKPPRCTSSELFFSCCSSVAALSALENCNGLVEKPNISRPRAPTPSALCTAPKARQVGVVKQLDPPLRDTCDRHFLLPVPNTNCHTKFATFLRPPHRRFPPASTCRRASAVTKWALNVRRWCATRTASAQFLVKVK